MPGWFSWRRRNEGFEWHEYVRTTIKLRREERKKKLEEIRNMAAEGAKEAGRQGMAAGRQGMVAGRHGIAASAHGLMRLAAMIAVWVRRVSVGAMRWSAEAGRRMLHGLRAGGARLGGMRWRVRPGPLSIRAKISLMFVLLGLLAAASAVMQFQAVSTGWSAALAAIVALALMGLAASPWLGTVIARLRAMDPFGGRFRVPVRAFGVAAAGLAAFAVVGGGALWWLGSEGTPASSGIVTSSIARVLPPLPSHAPEAGRAAELVQGRARALSGDTMEIDGRIVRLAHIEAVERGQVCRDESGRAWRCGQRAWRLLRRLTGRHTVVCRELSQEESNIVRGTCAAGGRDLAQAMVENGYAFADGFFLFKTYGDEESGARAAKRGLWQGEAERPADFRQARWAEAQKSAPDGCPIKGRVTRGAKVYLVPWDADYSRVRVSRARGGRWFCSEEDAAAAGFIPAESG